MTYALILASKVNGQHANPPVEGAVVVQCLGCDEDVWLEPSVAENAAEHGVTSVVIACTPCYTATKADLAAEDAESAEAGAAQMLSALDDA